MPAPRRRKSGESDWRWLTSLWCRFCDFSRTGAAESGGVAGRQWDIIATSTDVPWKQALRTVNSAGLVLRQEGNILHVHSQARQKEHSARQDAERLRLQAGTAGKPQHWPAIRRATELAAAGEKNSLSARGTIMVDKRTSRLLLRNRAYGGHGKWVSQMDLPVARN